MSDKLIKGLLLKTILEANASLDDAIKEFDEKITTAIRAMQHYLITVMQNMINYLDSRILEIRYVRRPTICDPSLVEGDCAAVNPNLYPALRRAMAQRLTPHYKDQIHHFHCGQSGCSLPEQIKAFAHIPYFMVTTCQRHQTILSTSFGITIHASYRSRLASGKITTINLVSTMKPINFDDTRMRDE